MSILTSKGKKSLIVDGFQFYKDNELNEKIYWRCSEFKNKCKARVHTIAGSIVLNLAEHNHAANAAKVHAKHIMTEIKTQALQSVESPHKIVSEVLSHVPLEVVANVPKLDNLKRNVRRQRQSKEDFPDNPSARNEFEIPIKYTNTTRNEEFLLFDSGKIESRMLLFGTKKFVDLMKSNRNWYVDGTFKKCPDVFCQIYTLHVIIKNKSIPVIYGLLPNKSKETYFKLFQKIKEFIGDVIPLSIMLDFELAVIQAIEEVFPGSLIRLCFFHLCQSLYRQICEKGLKAKYDKDIVFASKCKQLCSLAYVPVDQVEHYFELLADSFDGSPDQEHLDSIMDYFGKTYVSYKDFRQNKKEGRFKIAHWNFLGALSQNLPRTNNHQEGWHRSFNELVDKNSPNFWKLLNVFLIEQGKNEVVLVQLQTEVDDGPSPKKKYFSLWDRINKIVDKFDTMSPIEYLSAIASNISL